MQILTESDPGIFEKPFFGGSRCVSKLKRMNPCFLGNRVDLSLFFMQERLFITPPACVCIDMNQLNTMGVIMTWNVLFSFPYLHTLAIRKNPPLKNYQHLCPRRDLNFFVFWLPALCS